MRDTDSDFINYVDVSRLLIRISDTVLIENRRRNENTQERAVKWRPGQLYSPGTEPKVDIKFGAGSGRRSPLSCYTRRVPGNYLAASITAVSGLTRVWGPSEGFSGVDHWACVTGSHRAVQLIRCIIRLMLFHRGDAVRALAPSARYREGKPHKGEVSGVQYSPYLEASAANTPLPSFLPLSTSLPHRRVITLITVITIITPPRTASSLRHYYFTSPRSTNRL
ncbi:hypothetical protein E2C01_028541 [Portunus trituberculatus]|uniref:Uncharacterized protein n=1 Tax=Portunus trituberculatus TaxID=210409 RepID=A0A5B7EPB6_PORTR|nr:hypothetical protein [Portunus trituberculatus]